MSLFDSYHLMGDPAGYHHYITSPSDDVVHVQMLNHTSSHPRSSPLLSPIVCGPVQPADPLISSFFSFNEESPDSYDLLMSFTFPNATLAGSDADVSYPFSCDETVFSSDDNTGTLYPWLSGSLTTWSSMETLYDTTPSEIAQENYLDHLKNTPHPGRLYHVTNYCGGGQLRRTRQTTSVGAEKENKSRRGVVTKIRSLVRKLKK